MTSDSNDNIAVTCDGAQVKVNGADPAPATACNTITGIAVTGGPLTNTIDLSAVTTISFTALSTVTVHGAAASDIISGTAIADTLTGGTGDDTVFGLGGNDTIIWNPGDGSDWVDGGADNDLVIVNGGNVSETFTISATTTGARFDRVTPNPFFINIISGTENLWLGANGGADIVTGTVGLEGVLWMTLNGGDGDDNIKGGDGPDLLNGDGGNDTLVGFRGADTMNGGADDDTMVWNPGDGDDTADGGAGEDTMIVNGGNVSETFTISATTTGARFDRVTPNPFFVDIISGTENLVLNANDGNDIVTGTVGLDGVLLMTLNGGPGNDNMKGGDGDDELVGNQGADIMDGSAGDDTMIWNPGDGSDIASGGVGDDLVIVNGGNVSETFTISGTTTGARFDRVTPGPFFINIISPTERLLLNANGGADIVTGTVGLAGVITMTLNGGDGNDNIKGGNGPDLLNGDGGDDLLTGFQGADIMNGGLNNDTMFWNPGDGSDVANGGPNTDTMVVNGGNVSETFTISGTVTGARFDRVTPGPFFVDIISTTENLLLNANGGGDIVTGTVNLSGRLTMTLNGGAGNDHMKGGDGPDLLNGDAGDDTLVGFRGADTMNGGADNDTMIWNNGDGSDIMDGGPGDDTVVVNGGAISETFAITPSGTAVAAGLNVPLVGSVFFQRVTPGPFTLDIEAEGVEVNGNDGNDTFNVTPLDNTSVHYDGGGQTVADILRVNSLNRQVDQGPGLVQVVGKQPVTYENVEVLEILDNLLTMNFPFIKLND